MRKTERKNRILYLLLAAACLVPAAAGLCFGSVQLRLADLLGVLRGTAAAETEIILLQLRLPRVLAAGLAGIGLSAAGVLLQTATGNGLCAPNIVGINAGAGFAVLLVSCLLPGHWAALPGAAFLGAVFTAGIVLAVAFAGTGRLSKTTLILAGVAVSALMNAGISALSLRFPDAAAAYGSFSVGGFRGVELRALAIPAAVILSGTALSLLLAPRLELLLLGDEQAGALGVNVPLLRLAAVLLASALSAAVVSYAGLLGFVGLAVPHIARLLAGHSLRRCIPAAVLLGFALVIAADLAGRLLFAPSELPAGIITAVIGAPFFLWLLLRRRYRI